MIDASHQREMTWLRSSCTFLETHQKWDLDPTLVSYARFVYPDGSADVKFLISKSRVAPLKFMTIPRLELNAAVLAARLGAQVQKEHDINRHILLVRFHHRIVLGRIPILPFQQLCRKPSWRNIRNFFPWRLELYTDRREEEIQANSTCNTVGFLDTNFSSIQKTGRPRMRC